MTTVTQRSSPPWWVLAVASVIIGPGLLATALFTVSVVQTDAWKPVPHLRPVTAHPALDTSGVVAYVEPTHRGAEDQVRGCVFVVAASGESPPRRLGCTGDGAVPDTISAIFWTARGDIAVHSPLQNPTVLPVDAGPPDDEAIPELERTAGYRNDATLVRLAELTDDKAQIALQPPDGRARVIATIDGPDDYGFGSPQWSPDGRWILFSDTEGRLLILGDQGGEIRRLLGPRPARRWIEAPLLTWHQGEAR